MSQYVINKGRQTFTHEQTHTQSTKLRRNHQWAMWIICSAMSLLSLSLASYCSCIITLLCLPMMTSLPEDSQQHIFCDTSRGQNCHPFLISKRKKSVPQHKMPHKPQLKMQCRLRLPLPPQSKPWLWSCESLACLEVAQSHRGAQCVSTGTEKICQLYHSVSCFLTKLG